MHIAAIAAISPAVIQIPTSKPSGMRKLGPERIPAAAGIFAAASVCIAADSVFVDAFIEVAVISAFDGPAALRGISVASASAAVGRPRFYSTAAAGAIGHHRSFRPTPTGSVRLYKLRFRIAIQRIGHDKARSSIFTSHKKYRHSPRSFFFYPSRAKDR